MPMLQEKGIVPEAGGVNSIIFSPGFKALSIPKEGTTK